MDQVESVKTSKALKEIFLEFKDVSHDFIPDERCVWIDLVGLPLASWAPEVYKKLVVESLHRVIESFIVSYRNRTYRIIATEFAYWAPNIESMEVNSESNPLERKDAEGCIKDCMEKIWKMMHVRFLEFILRVIVVSTPDDNGGCYDQVIAPEKDSIIAPPSTPPGNDLNIAVESGSSWIDYIGPLTSDEIDPDKRWSYRDPNGNIHGSKKPSLPHPRRKFRRCRRNWRRLTGDIEKQQKLEIIADGYDRKSISGRKDELGLFYISNPVFDDGENGRRKKMGARQRRFEDAETSLLRRSGGNGRVMMRRRR
ncbi:hypothetical protein Tco_0603479 [Tanacetum coccineum]